MSVNALPWLPVCGARRDVVQAAVGQAVADWSALWFARPPLAVASVLATHDAARDNADGAGWKLYGQAVAISCSTRASGRLAAWALDAPLDELSPRKGDRRLLDLFERRLIEDLAQTVERAIGVEGEGQGRPQLVRAPFDCLGGAVVELADEFGAPVLSLAIPLSAVLPMLRASLPASPRLGGRIATFAQALGGADLVIEASLGAAEVPVADLRTLAPGDVLLLTRGPEEAVDVSLAGSDNPFAQAKLIDLDGQMALALQA